MAVTRRSRWAAGVAASSIALFATGMLMLRGGSTPVGVDNVVERYRQHSDTTVTVELTPEEPAAAPGSTPSPATPSPATVAPKQKSSAVPLGRPLPPEGVYVYDTTGSESVDVFGGSQHTYPETTTITVRHSVCGATERWDALEERWDERQTCREAHGDRLRTFTSYHRFFSQEDRRTMQCEGLVYPVGAARGDTWLSTCRGEEGTARSEGKAIGFENLAVDGRQVRALHVRVTTTLSGGQAGSSRRDVWGSLETGIVLREIAMTDSTGHEPVVGKVRYRESYEIRLRSLEPRR